MVGLPVNLPRSDFSHQLSGGQKARVGIARAYPLHPKLVYSRRADRALDVSGTAWSELAAGLEAVDGYELSVCVADLNVVRFCRSCHCDRTGRIGRQGPSRTRLGRPQDAYTKELLTAIPHPPLPV